MDAVIYRDNIQWRTLIALRSSLREHILDNEIPKHSRALTFKGITSVIV